MFYGMNSARHGTADSLRVALSSVPSLFHLSVPAICPRLNARSDVRNRLPALRLPANQLSPKTPIAFHNPTTFRLAHQRTRPLSPFLWVSVKLMAPNNERRRHVQERFERCGVAVSSLSSSTTRGALAASMIHLLRTAVRRWPRAV